MRLALDNCFREEPVFNSVKLMLLIADEQHYNLLVWNTKNVSANLTYFIDLVVYHIENFKKQTTLTGKI